MSSSAGPHTAFFYGTLMAPKVLHRVCHGPVLQGSSNTPHNNLTIRPALLKSYRRHRVLDADYPAIIPHENSTVRGTLVQGLTDGDIWRLDIFEGDEYERRKVKVRTLTDEGDQNIEPEEGQLGEEIEAESYIWIAGEDSLEDKEWDFQHFMREKMHAWAGEADETRDDILEVDDAVKAQERDPTGGRSLNGGIGKALEEDQAKVKEVLINAV